MKSKKMNHAFHFRAFGPGAAAVLLGVLLCASCGGAASSRRQADTVSAPAERRYSLPLVPGVIAEPSERAEYVLDRYWNKFDFRDTTWLADTAAFEQTFANYMGVAGMVPRDRAAASLRDLFAAASVEPSMYRRFAEVAELYLYEPNSPMRDEELYESVLLVLLDSQVLDEDEKVRPRHQLWMCSKNKVGSRAADIRYRTPSGATGKLYGLTVPYVILFFHDPDCGMCREVAMRMDASPAIRKLIDAGRLVVLCIYADEDEQAWRSHVAQMPLQGWIYGWDKWQTLRTQESYDLRATPTLYLLGPRQEVLVKNGVFPAIEQMCVELDNPVTNE